MSRRSFFRALMRFGKYFAALVVVVVMLFPIYTVFLTSVQREIDVRSRELNLFPRYIVLEHYREVLRPGHIVPVAEATRNSFILSVSASLLAMALSSMGAYALVRLKFRGKKVILFGLTAVYLLPAILFVIPLFVWVVQLGVVDTFISLIIPYAAFMTPFMIWILKSFFEKVPVDLESAAMIDGCTLPQLIFRVLLPLSIPGLVATFVFGFILSWNEFLTPLVFTSSDFPIITVVLGLYRGTVDIKIGQQAAAAFLALLPVILLTLVFQRMIIGGLLAGSEK